MRWQIPAAALPLFVAFVFLTGSAQAEQRVRAEDTATPQRVLDYWTPARMRQAVPIEQVEEGSAFTAPPPGATASFQTVTGEIPAPYSSAGRIYGLAGGFRFFCSGVAVNTPTRRVVLTAGHCLVDRVGRHRAWTRYLEFVPSYTFGAAPYGAFAMETGYLPLQYYRWENLNYDIASVLTYPNESGEYVADAVGGGANVAAHAPRKENYLILGYPGWNQQQMRKCGAYYLRGNPESWFFPGKAQNEVTCDLPAGSSGGPWFVASAEGPLVAGVTSRGGWDRSLGYKVLTSVLFCRETSGTVLDGL